MRQIRTEEGREIGYDPQSYTYHIQITARNGFTFTSNIKVEKCDKNGSVISEGITIADLQAVLDDIAQGSQAGQIIKTKSVKDRRIERVNEVPDTDDAREPDINEDWDEPADEDIPPDIPIKEQPKEQREKKKKGLLRKVADKFTGKDLHKHWESINKRTGQEGFQRLEITEEGINYFKNLDIIRQREILMQFPEMRHKLDKFTKIDVSKLKTRRTGKSKREKDIEFFNKA